MSHITRRQFLRVGASLAAGLGLSSAHGELLAKGLEKISSRQEKVLWLQGMSCSGCSVSLLNCEAPGPLEVLTEIISLVYHQTISAAQGADVERLIQQLVEKGDFYLVLEGAVPMAMPEACIIAGKPLVKLLPPVLKAAKGIIAAGTCAAFGGVPAAEGNSTAAAGLKEFMQREGIPYKNRLVHCTGCPVHPQALVGTLAYLVAKGYPKVHPELLTPQMFFATSVHDDCPRYHHWEKRAFAKKFGDEGCLFQLGCLGPLSHANCSRSQWNSGVNWCVRAGAPCNACTSEHFAKRRDFPFYRKGEEVHAVAYCDEDRGRAES
ncbi:MAG: hydrogenase small subunit [Planctomycetota bacterium]